MKQTNILIAAVVCLLSMSCEKLIDIGEPENRLGKETVFMSDASALSAVSGIYSGFMSFSPELMCGGVTVYAGLTADELLFTGTTAETLEFSTNSISPANSVNHTNIWLRAYQGIYRINACLEGMEASTGMSPKVKNQLMGECYFLRALNYYYLSSLMGKVPLLLKTNYEINAVAPRVGTDTIARQLISDLTTALGLLDVAYPSPGRVRVNQHAARALLSRVYLNQGNWAAAEEEAGRVISTSGYLLEKDLANVFLASSQESILQFMPVLTGYNTTEGSNFVPSTSATSRPLYILTPQLLGAFEPTDKRAANWIAKKTVSSIVYAYPYKYKVRANFTTTFTLTEHYTVLRLAEQYLNRAEARARQNKLPGAIQDLDSIRTRAGIPLLAVTNPAISQADLLTAIAKERRVELFAEWGFRWFDLKRTGTADAVLKPMKTGWASTDTLWPIPASQRLANPALTQNEGYNF